MTNQIGFTPKFGNEYTPALLHCEGWTEGDGSGHEGYRLEDYFDWHESCAGRKYLGPDEHGIEPIVSRLSGDELV